MCTNSCCNELSCCGARSIMRCASPLIEICDTTTRINLNLSSCDPCAGKPSALLLQKAGCKEWITVCEPQPEPCCGVEYNFPQSVWRRKAVEKPKPSIIYPLHEIDANGMSVFVLDSKLKELGYGRYVAKVLVDTAKQPEQCTDQVKLDPIYVETGVEFDVEYLSPQFGLVDITTDTAKVTEC